MSELPAEINTPYTVVVRQASDFLKLENAIRYLLKCKGPTCSFFHSAEYAAIKIAAMHSAMGNPSVKNMDIPSVVYITGSPYVLHINKENYKTIVVSFIHDLNPRGGCEKSVSFKKAASKKRKWKKDNDDNDGKDNDNDNGGGAGGNDDKYDNDNEDENCEEKEAFFNGKDDMVSKMASECRLQKLSALETKFLYAKTLKDPI
jgi:hypothetical protein